MTIGIILLVVLIFGFLIFVHELGHFVAARRAGVKVEEFGFGFPPKLFGIKKGETVYSLNLIPLGGFVRMKGENIADERPRSFGAAPFWAKVRILLAGVFMNAVTAYVILVYLCLTGLPPVIADQFSFGASTYNQPKQVMAVAVAEGSPAAKAGIERGDIILKGNDQALTSERELMNFTKEKAGKEVTVEVSQEGQTKQVEVTLLPPDSKQGFLGVTPFQTYQLRYNLIDSLITAAGLLGQLIWATLAAFGGLVAGLFFHHQVTENVAGPVGIVSLLGSVVDLGLAYVLIFVASISISLAVINALPLPALDGGRLAIVVGQKLTKRKMSEKLETAIHAGGFVAFIVLMMVVTYFDVKRLGG